MSRCGDPRCGVPQEGPGHPRKGWLSVKQVGVDDKPLWFCSTRCVVEMMTSYYPATIYIRPELPKAVHVPPEQLTEVEALQMLSVLGGQPLSLMNATGKRVRAALDKACERLLATIHDQDARDRRNRPSIGTLIAEVAGEQPVGDDMRESA